MSLQFCVFRILTLLSIGRIGETGFFYSVQVSIRQHGNTVATVAASVQTLKVSSATSGYATKTESDGSKEITNVFFAGKKMSLNLDQQAAAQSAANPGNK